MSAFNAVFPARAAVVISVAAHLACTTHVVVALMADVSIDRVVR